MGLQIAAINVELVSNQAGVSLQQQDDGQLAAISLSFAIAPGHYSKYQVLEKTKRLLADASAYIQAEMARSA